MAEYFIKKRILSIAHEYTILDHNKCEIGKFRKKLLSVGAKYIFTDTLGNEIGSIHKKIITLRRTYRILDARRRLVATMKKKLLKLIGTEYWFEDPDGVEILRMKGRFHAHYYSLEGPSGGEFAEIKKKWLSLRTSYSADDANSANDFLVLSAVICIDDDLRDQKRRSD